MDDDIIRCAPSAAGADVCWIQPDRVPLMCGGFPWDEHLHRATVKSRLAPVTKPGPAPPWGLELEGGAEDRRAHAGHNDTNALGRGF